jgi:hypothetical protein
VRQEVEKLSGVSRTWYEHTWEKDGWAAILVVEVDFSTDPNAYNGPPALEEIAHTVIETLENIQQATALLVCARGKSHPHAQIGLPMIVR